MSTAEARAKSGIKPSLLEVFVARAEARATLWAAGELTLHDAVDELWAAAVRDGLVAKLSADRVQQLLADAFAPVRDDLPRNEPTESVDVDDTFAAACRAADEKHFRKPCDPRFDRLRDLMDDDVSLDRAWRPPGDVPRATLKAAEYLMRLGDLQRWKKWFDAHTPAEQAAIFQHLEERKRRRGK